MKFFLTIFSWSYYVIALLKMIRRLLCTFIDHQIPNADMNMVTNAVIPGSFKLQQLDSLNWLHSDAPCFPVDGSKIKIIYEPSQFYDTIFQQCAIAKKRIVLASLYLGVGHLEKALIAQMLNNLKENSQLQINILLDFTRGTRGKINSKTILMPLIKESDNVSVSLYHTPALRGLTKKLAPPRWNELVGLQHMKLYLFDKTVIVSGANLSNDYFTNRQDRYIMIEDERLSDFFANLVTKVQEFSLQVKKCGNVELHSEWNLMPYKSARVDFVTQARQKIFNYFTNVIEEQNNSNALTSVAMNSDTWIFPLIEMGQLGIHHDSLVTKNLLSCSLKHSELKLATGYFNLTDGYMDTITNDCLADCSILMAHPNANGFQGAKGPAGGIPAAYTLIARKFYEKIVNAKQDHRISLFEYQKPGWSYHAKGLWYYLPGSKNPNLTLIGSSNFGERSVNRDLETQICLVTTNSSLQKNLQKECDYLYQKGSVAEEELQQRPVPKWVRLIVSLFRNYF